MNSLLLVFVHGYSVTNLDTYGELPLRLRNEATLRGIEIKIENIYLGRYISFNDDVRLNDVSQALDTAIKEQVSPGTRFICITHSTGGPVVRNWWNLFYKNQTSLCPMSHLIMLAPANQGSALAQLGKTRLSRIKSWFDGVEPGQKILDWLELGSSAAWDLNKDWIMNGGKHISEQGIFPFVLTGQNIDRKLYDHINSYTGEAGSDGVVRVASADINSRYIRLEQQPAQLIKNKLLAPELQLREFVEAPPSPTRILTNKSHSGDKMGILKSVLRTTDDENSKETIEAIFKCSAVNSKQTYQALCTEFAAASTTMQKEQRVETEAKLFGKNHHIHDRYAMVIFRVTDNEGYPLTNFDLLLTAGPNSDPDMLPPGFFADRQCNRINQCTITYFFNYDLMVGSEAIVKDGEVLRKGTAGIESLGLIITPRPEEGFVRYLPCKINASKELLEKALRPNSTTLIDICIRRIVSKEVFRFEAAEENKAPSKNFKNTKPGNEILP